MSTFNTGIPEAFESHILSSAYQPALSLLTASTSHLSSLPRPPAPGALRATAAALATHRALCLCVRDACDFSRAFEASFAHREALLAAGAAHGAAAWAVASLRATLFSPENARAAAAALRALAASPEGRAIVGRDGGVRALLHAWRRFPVCVEVVGALVVVCSGHVDNISRFVREDGVAMCVRVCGEDRVAVGVKEKVLLLVGMCCVCLPDDGRGGELVGVVVSVLRDVLGGGRRRAEVYGLAANALAVLGNVGETVARENYMCESAGDGSPLPGYDVNEPEEVVAVIVAAWEKWRRSWNIVSPAAWALVAMTRAKQIDLTHFPHLMRRVRTLLNESTVQSSSARALKVILGSGDVLAVVSKERGPKKAAVGEKRKAPPSDELTQAESPKRRCSPRGSVATSPFSVRESDSDTGEDPGEAVIDIGGDDEGEDNGLVHDDDDDDDEFRTPFSGRARGRGGAVHLKPELLTSPVTPAGRRSSRVKKQATYGDGSLVGSGTIAGRRL